MCRWLAYSGQPIFLEELVTQPKYSLLDQSLHTRMNFHRDGNLWTTNGDGFGVGWYGGKKEPGLFKDARPAWNDINLREICSQVQSGLFMAHIRATTTGAVQRSNSHPFKEGNWLFQHNGYVNDFEDLRRDLQMDIDPVLYKNLKGTTDSETFFFLALTYGLAENPKEAMKNMVRRVDKACKDNKKETCLNLSCAISDGKQLITIRYALGDKTKSQYYSTESGCVKDFNNKCIAIPEGSVIVVSEPLSELSDQWIEIPDNSFCVIRSGSAHIEKFMDTEV